MRRSPLRGCGFLLPALLLLLTLPATAISQDNTDPILTYFNGGTMNLNAELTSMLVGGSGVTSIAVGGAAPVQADPYTVLRNPAGMRFVRRDVIFGFTVHPRLGIQFSSMPFDVASGVNEAVDGYAEAFQVTDDFSYPDFTGSVARSGDALSSFAMAIPAGAWRLGFGYARPFQMKLSLLQGGLRQRIDTVEEDPNEVVGLAIQTRIGTRMEIASHSWTAALSFDPLPWLTMGVSGSRTNALFDLVGGYNVDGIMTRAGQQWAFNSDLDPWYNTLSSDATGGYSGTWWTWRAGFTISGQSQKSWRLGADIALHGESVLHGGMHLLVDEFPALKLSVSGDEDPFDVNRIDDVTEITRTYPNEYLTGDELRLYIPDAVTVTIAAGGGLRPSLTGVYYLGDGFGYDLEVSEKGINDTSYTARTYGRGLIPQYQGYLGIAPGGFFMGVGAILCEDYVHGYVDGNGLPIPDGNQIIIPRFDIGFSFHITSNLRYELLIAALPEDIFRMGVMYEF